MYGDQLRGQLTAGIGQGKHFTSLAWARQQFMEKLGIDPFPGTINLIVDDSESLRVWSRIKSEPGVRIDNPNDGPHDCDARCYPVLIEGQLHGAIVLPEVPGYSPAQIEIIAAKGIRDALGVTDGDEMELEVKWPQTGMRQAH